MKRHERANDLVTGRSPRGLSLMELLFTITLLGVILLAILNLIPGSLMAIRHAEHRLEASSFAESMLEEKRAGTFSQIVDEFEGPQPIMQVLKGNDETVYECIYGIYDVPGANRDYLRSISITVTWEEKENKFSIHRKLFVCSVKK